MKDIEFLSQVPIFQRLPKTELKKISSLIEAVEFKDGETIFSEGSPGDSLYIVAQGDVIILKALSKSQLQKTHLRREEAEKIVTTFQKGDFFGEIALLDEVPRTASARAKGNVTVLRIEREMFWDFVKSNASVALQTIVLLARTMSERLRQTTMELAVVYELGKIFSSSMNQKEIAVKIIEQIRTVLPEGSFTALALWNEFNEEFEWAGISESEKMPAELKRNLSRNEPIPKLFETRKTYFLSTNWDSESSLSSEEKKLYGSYEGTLLVMPLLKTQEAQLLSSGHWITSYPLIGLLFCCHKEKKDAFDRHLVHLLSTVAHLSSTALENCSRREEELARSRHALQRQTIID